MKKLFLAFALMFAASFPVFAEMKHEHSMPMSKMEDMKHQMDTLETKADEFDLRLQLEIFLKVCDAVAFAHAHHIVHRDLKPGNVMIGDFGEVMLMDWGLAFDVSPGGDRGLATPRAQASPIAGTPAYMDQSVLCNDCHVK